MSLEQLLRFISRAKFELGNLPALCTQKAALEVTAGVAAGINLHDCLAKSSAEVAAAAPQVAGVEIFSCEISGRRLLAVAKRSAVLNAFPSVVGLPVALSFFLMEHIL